MITAASQEEIIAAIIEGNMTKSHTCLKNMLQSGFDNNTVIDEIILPAINKVGLIYKTGDFFITDVISASRVVKSLLRVLTSPEGNKPKLPVKAKILMGTVHGDIHDIGKTIVKILLEADGYSVYDLGVNVSGQEFIRAIEEYNPQVVMLSAMLTSTMQYMGDIIKLIEENNLRKNLKVMIGGSHIMEHYAETIGADCYTDSAAQALEWLNDNV